MIEITHFSVVVLAQSHNPTILNPDFLRNTGIVHADYKIKNFICTPPVAQVVYEEGISIIAEFEKIQFIDELLGRRPEDSSIPQIAVDYIGKLPYVNYTAAGINFAGHKRFSDHGLVRDFIRNTFVQDGPWIDKSEITDIGLNFVYSSGNVKRNVNINPGEYKKTEDHASPIVMIRYNHHLEAPNNTASISEFILDWKKALMQYMQFNENIFGDISK